MISFIHRGGPTMASYRYRCQMPAKWLGAAINDPTADVLVFCKPQPFELAEARDALLDGRTVIADFCDNHFVKLPHYIDMSELAHQVTCPTLGMKYLIGAFGRSAIVVPESYEYEERPPHCNGDKLLWFGHSSNLDSLRRIGAYTAGHPLRIVSDAPGTIPWSLDTLGAELAWADIVVLPETAPYKSPNRAVEAIRQGCFVVAEPHASLKDFPIWKGNIAEGIAWATTHPQEANEMTREAQLFVTSRFSPQAVASAWRSLLKEYDSTLAAANAAGQGGSTSTSAVPMSALTSGGSRFPTTTPTAPAPSTSSSISTSGKSRRSSRSGAAC